MENLGWKLLSRISNFGGGKFGVKNAVSNMGGGKFGVENAISNLEFGGWKIWGGKCYLESRIWGGGKFVVEKAISKFLIWGAVENLGWKMLSRISNLAGGKFGVENAISKLQLGRGGNLE